MAGPAFFDSERNCWVLTRYVDVMSALHHTGLEPDGEKSESRAAVLDALSVPSRLEELDRLAREAAGLLPCDRPVDLVSEYAVPWCLRVAELITGARSDDLLRLTSLAATVSAAAAEPRESELRAPAGAANRELSEYFATAPLPMAGPAFVALSQTLPALLANAWLVLLQHPLEVCRLRAQEDVMPRAVEELLRLCGLPRFIRRRAVVPVRFGGVAIAEGDAVELSLAEANRDEAQFADPLRFDPARSPARQLALGAAAHACVGAPLIRAAIAAGTAALIAREPVLEMRGEPVLRGGSGFQWPEAVWCRLTLTAEPSARTLPE